MSQTHYHFRLQIFRSFFLRFLPFLREIKTQVFKPSEQREKTPRFKRGTQWQLEIMIQPALRSEI